MSAEQVDERGVAPVSETTRSNVAKNLSNASFRILLERRAKEIEEGVKKIEATQVLPAETMRLQFHAPGEG